jgi:hypothetical protein
MTKDEFIAKIHERIANTAVGGSALRNQGVSGIVDASRTYFLSSVHLNEFFDGLKQQDSFKSFLNKHTTGLIGKFKKLENGNQNQLWGAARKGLNLFLRDLVYNKFIAEKYGLSSDFLTLNRQIDYLEVPLDSFVGNEIFARSNKQIPKWTSIKELTPQKSELYQEKAQQIAIEEGIARVHLDLIFWRPSQLRPT